MELTIPVRECHGQRETAASHGDDECQNDWTSIMPIRRLPDRDQFLVAQRTYPDSRDNQFRSGRDPR
jgi:hypothetical protein